MLLLLNRLFPLPAHPFNLRQNGDMTYAEWQFENGARTLAFFSGLFPPSVMLQNKRILDVGCGAGGKSLYYASLGANVTGIDTLPQYAAESAELAQKKGLSHRFHFVCGSADALPFPDGSFDGVILNDAVEHISNPETAISECIRVLSPGGRVYINFPPYGHPYGAHVSDVIGIPWVQFLFPEKSIVKAYKKLVSRHPDAAERIDFRISSDKNGREYFSYINKMSIKRFKKIVRNKKLVCYREVPLRPVFAPFAKIPRVKELCVRMVVAVIER